MFFIFIILSCGVVEAGTHKTRFVMDSGEASKRSLVEDAVDLGEVSKKPRVEDAVDEAYASRIRKFEDIAKVFVLFFLFFQSSCTGIYALTNFDPSCLKFNFLEYKPKYGTSKDYNGYAWN